MGHRIIDRPDDPDDPDLDGIDFASPGNARTLDDFYRYRILERREFAAR